MNASTNKLAIIFHASRILKIPFFQRSYVWNVEEWERLLHDLLDKQDNRVNGQWDTKFMGALIFKQEKTPTGSYGDVRGLVDGQQRLTTIVVLMKVLSIKLNIAGHFDRQFKDANGNVVIKHNLNDYRDFEEVMAVTHQSQKLKGSGRIIELFKYFMNHEEVDRLEWNFVMNALEFVVIDLDASEDEQEIFDSINSLGVQLTTSELLKNYLFNRDQENLYNKTWREEFENTHVDFWNKDFTAGRVSRSLQDVFFHAFLQVKVQEPSLNVSTADKDRFSKVGELFKSYRKFIEDYAVDKSQLVDEIVEYAELFRHNIDVDILRKSIPQTAGMERMNVIIFGLENSTVLPYLLYVLKYSDNAEVTKICQYLEAYLCRRLICKNESNNYNKLFTKELIGNSILTGSALQTFVSSQRTSTAVNRMPSDQEYHKAWLENKISNKVARGVLYLLETGTSSAQVSLYGLTSYSLEHVLPKKWQNHWPSPPAPFTKEERDDKLLTLGNLTLINQKLNTSIRDYSWLRKLDGSTTNPGLRECSSGIEIMSTYLHLPDWNEHEIEKRAHELEKKSLRKWDESPLAIVP